jgi:hypothetical protein
MIVPAGEVEHDFKSLRKMAANYMLQHESHFKNFLSLAKETFQVIFDYFKSCFYNFPTSYGVLPSAGLLSSHGANEYVGGTT